MQSRQYPPLTAAVFRNRPASAARAARGYYENDRRTVEFCPEESAIVAGRRACPGTPKLWKLAMIRSRVLRFALRHHIARSGAGVPGRWSSDAKLVMSSRGGVAHDRLVASRSRKAVFFSRIMPDTAALSAGKSSAYAARSTNPRHEALPTHVLFRNCSGRRALRIRSGLAVPRRTAPAEGTCVERDLRNPEGSWHAGRCRSSLDVRIRRWPAALPQYS